MIEKIYELSKSLTDSPPPHIALSRIPRRNFSYAVTIDIDSNEYLGVRTLEIGEENSEKYLFRETPGNLSISKSPSINLQKKEKLDRVFKKFLEFFNNEKTKHIYDIIEENKERILRDLEEKNDLEKAILTLLVRTKGEELFPSEVDEIKEIFVEKNTSVDNKKSVNKCFLCGKEVPSFPVVNEIFRFASFDKPGFTPSLSGDASGILGICKDCRIHLEYGRRFIEENLSFKFFGDTLWIIPSGDRESVKRIVKTFRKMEKDIYSRQELRSFGKIERKIEERLKDEESLSYDFIVMHFENQAEKIMLSMNEIPPSRLSKIVVEGEEVRKSLGIDPTLAVIRPFLKSKGGKTKAFYELVRCIYTGSKYSKFTLLSHIVDSLRETFKENDILKHISIKGKEALAVYMYLRRLDVLKGGEKVEIDKYGDFFNEPWKKAVFLTGAMAAYIMKYQQRERNSTPFSKKLKGLKMRERDVKEIFKEIRAKAIQYGIDDEEFDKISEYAAESFLKSGDWKADLEELNFIFSVGMAMHERIFRRRYEDEKE